MVNSNILIIVAAVASQILGMIWYSPKVFGSAWMKMVGVKDNNDKSGMGKKVLIAFLGALVTAYVLIMLINLTGLAAVRVAFYVWLGFIATTTMGSFLWEMKPFNLWILNNAYSLVNLVMVALIVSY